MEYATSSQMAAMEINSEYFGVPVATLMENAGREVFLALRRKFKNLKGKSVVIYCGSGNNGGDGFVAARHLELAGAKVCIILVEKSVKSTLARRNLGHVSHLVEKTPPKNPDIIIDAILGTGIKGAPRPAVRSFVRKINSSKAFKLSVDVPTGLGTDTGHGAAVHADMVVTFHRAKKGLERYNTKVVDIGIPQEAGTHVGPGDIIVNLKRKADSHKGENGRVLVVGGSDLYHGAPILSGIAAHNCGADLVFMCVPEGNFDVTRAASPGFIVRKYTGDYLTPGATGRVLELSGECDALLIGPGLGARQETKDAVIEILENIKIPVVIDADAIKALGEKPEVLRKIDAVVTPHTREFTRLTGKKLTKTEKSRIKLLKEEASRLGCIILLKSPADIIASTTAVKLNTTGNPGMTAGGTGDVLAGLVAGFASQKVPLFESACLGAFINGAAGDELLRWKGHAYTAMDVLGEISNTIKRTLDLMPPK